MRRFLPVRLFFLSFLFYALPAQAGELMVSAAASLTNAFKEIGQAYEARYAGSKVWLNFGASGALLQQIIRGAPVDVFASADQETMDEAQRRSLILSASRQDFVRNSLVLILPADSRRPPGSLADLARPSVRRIAIGNPASVPVGRYSRYALEAAGLWEEFGPRLVYATHVRQVLDYVVRGEVDAGFVYVTDADLMKGKVRVAMEIPLDKKISYPAAITTEGENREEAARFLAFIVSPAGRAILTRYGFQHP